MIAGATCNNVPVKKKDPAGKSLSGIFLSMGEGAPNPAAAGTVIGPFCILPKSAVL
jgi:hypothetical protein